jgi:hypothetical protein
MAENSNNKKQQIVFASGEIDAALLEANNLVKNEGEGHLSYAIKQAMGTAKKTSTPRIAFTEDPVGADHYAGVYKLKKRLLPDSVIKMIRTQNHLIASILRARANTMSMFGHIKKDRFDIGVSVEVKADFEPYIKPEQMVKVQDRIERFKRILINCGSNEGLKDNEKMTLSEFFYLQTIDGMSFGRFATEIVYEENDNGNPHELSDRAKKFNRFRPADAGTMYKTVKKGESASSIRASGIRQLQSVTGNKIRGDLFESDEYAWVQVIDGMPKQAFASDEMVVYNLFPSNDIDHNGYPVTPIDTCISSITTHLSIDAYNKLYFQNGRASKGILVVQSEEIDQNTINSLKQEFMASINNVGNSFRVPVFGVGTQDNVNWLPMVSSAGDGEFQFLYDAVARNILSTFSMSPDELPGYGHLSRGTNQQTLSESSNEFKLTAARDTGLRPLILKFQAFINEKLFQIIDPELAQICTVSLSGLDAQSKEQESLRLQQDMPIHMTYDEVLSGVDKEQIGERMGGKVPFNERYQIIADKYMNVSDMMAEYMKDPSALADPMLKYKRDPFWIQSAQILMQVNPAAVKAYYATKPYTLDILKMMAQDYIEENEE